MVVQLALPLKRKHFTLSVEEGMDHSLNMTSATVDTLAERCNLYLGVGNWLRLSCRAAKLLYVSGLRGV